MTTLVVPQDLWSYCNILQSEIQCLHNHLDPVEYGDAAASTTDGHHWRVSWDSAHWTSNPSTPTPTPAVIAIGHTNIPLADTLPMAADSPDRYSCMLVVPDTVVGHIIGRGGKGLHQAHEVPDQQVGEALIALGKCFMRKHVRTKRKGPSHPSEGPAPPPAHPVPAPPCTVMYVDPRLAQCQARAPAYRKLAQDLCDDGGPQPTHVGMQDPLTGQVMASPTSTPCPKSTPFAPSVTMSTLLPTGRLPVTI
ncbi:hypothetical protein B0H14DRAFT_2580798 [Mycena olivaceomarginata]|nr:hypothetical protein B0H14DRAFT_2580798 [Mycena olivaceomarginata]